MSHYVTQLTDGKTFRPCSFTAALTVIAIHFDLFDHDIRVLSRNTNSWYIYQNEFEMLQDVNRRQRTNWIGIIRRE